MKFIVLPQSEILLILIASAVVTIVYYIYYRFWIKIPCPLVKLKQPLRHFRPPTIIKRGLHMQLIPCKITWKTILLFSMCSTITGFSKSKLLNIHLLRGVARISGGLLIAPNSFFYWWPSCFLNMNVLVGGALCPPTWLCPCHSLFLSN